MKQTIFTFLVFAALGLISCKKTTVYPNIKQYDQNEILNYMSVHGITGMKRDTVGGDTSGIYYQVVLPPSGTHYQYTDSIAFVYSLQTFDGKYTSLDTTYNHYDALVGHIYSSGLPYGLQLVVKDVLLKGGALRVLIPSHLAYGVDGYGSGSSTVANNRIGGNECLDYYIHSIVNEPPYDDMVIKNILAANGLTGYTRTADGLYYLLRAQGIGTDSVTNNSTVTLTYTAQLLNGNIFDQYNTTDQTGTAIDIPDAITGLQEAFKHHTTTGANISLFIPSQLAYGKTGISGVPPNSCIHYEAIILGVSP